MFKWSYQFLKKDLQSKSTQDKLWFMQLWDKITKFWYAMLFHHKRHNWGYKKWSNEFEKQWPKDWWKMHDWVWAGSRAWERNDSRWGWGNESGSDWSPLSRNYEHFGCSQPTSTAKHNVYYKPKTLQLGSTTHTNTNSYWREGLHQTKDKTAFSSRVLLKYCDSWKAGFLKRSHI